MDYRYKQSKINLINCRPSFVKKIRFVPVIVCLLITPPLMVCSRDNKNNAESFNPLWNECIFASKVYSFAEHDQNKILVCLAAKNIVILNKRYFLLWSLSDFQVVD